MEKNKLNQMDLHLVEFFQTQQKKYCYVSHTNSLIELGDLEWNILYHDKNSRELSKEGEDILLEVFQVSGIKFFEPPKYVRFPYSKKEICEYLENGLMSITLSLTEACNLACDYCIYSGSYVGSRGPSMKTISKNVAFRAIDFFLKRSETTKEPVISFYGGEPLLRYELMRDCIEYASNNSQKDLLFSFTTNGTLLTTEKVEFFNQHNTTISVSIDGPKEIHDKYRHTENNIGSHQSIVENLTEIQKAFPNFYKNNIHFISVVTHDSNILEIDKFFSENGLFNQNIIIVTSVRSSGNPMFPPYEFISTEISDEYVKNKISRNESEKVFLKRIFEKSFVRFHTRVFWSGYPTDIYPNGICLPGARKLFVTCDGDFKICERVASSKTIGNVYDGFDLLAVQSFVDEYVRLCNPDCLRCWANRLCKMCYASIYVEEISPELKKQKCFRIRSRILDTMIRYCEILEKNPLAFD